ncbi:putative G-protein coupled receptor Mth-like 3 [Anticarsia gemmatalis]|uniref:putative G-protein coupled receptor Mth-like 3 n=1 Tax=Anticarsia gemmatalis TaxID=129554 RepID=UPI003F772637
MVSLLLFVTFVIVRTTVSQPPCNPQNSVELTNRTYNGITYGEGEYFVDNVTGLERGCVCMKKTCARKCCPFGEGRNWDHPKHICDNFTQEFDPPVFENYELKKGFDAKKEFHFFLSKMKCAEHEFRLVLLGITEDIHLEMDGRLNYTIVDGTKTSKILDPDKYCIDQFIFQGSVVQSALICNEPKKSERSRYLVMNAACMYISCFFIILTVIVYAILPEIRRTLHGMVMLAHLSSFFVAFLFLATMQVLLTHGMINQNCCTAMTLVIYFAMLSAFFWMNVMCFDSWWKFRKLEVPNTPSKRVRPQDLRRFLMYCVYAYGVPIALTILVAALEFSGLSMYNELMPRLRQRGCFIDGTGRLIYLYTPILFVCCSDVVFIALVVKRILEHRKQTQQLLHKKATQRFTLYIKLFVITGFNWVLEVLSMVFREAHHFWKYTDAFNMLVGLTIFITFVCNKKIYKALKATVFLENNNKTS